LIFVGCLFTWTSIGTSRLQPAAADYQADPAVKTRTGLDQYAFVLRRRVGQYINATPFSLADCESLDKKTKVTYDLLWTLFKPNTLAYAKCFGIDQPRCVRYELGKRPYQFNKSRTLKPRSGTSYCSQASPAYLPLSKSISRLT
jgi:hypothetical protein